MMGAIELLKGELRVLYVNKAASEFFDVKQNDARDNPLFGLRVYDTEALLSLYQTMCMVHIYII